MTNSRLIIVTIDSILALLRDYLGTEAVPVDAQPHRLLVKPSEMGKFAIVAAADSWNGPQPATLVQFDIRRMFAVASPQKDSQ